VPPLPPLALIFPVPEILFVIIQILPPEPPPEASY